jgi:hypothetical protein
MRIPLYEVAIALVCAFTVAHTAEWSGIRCGIVHLRTSKPVAATVRWSNVWAAEGHDEVLYLQAQNGNLIKRIAIPAAKVDGNAVLNLPAAGDYCLTIPGYSFRLYAISAPAGCVLEFEPTIHHPSIQPTGLLQWRFKVDRSGPLTLHAKDHNGAPAVRLIGPDNKEFLLPLRPVKSIPYREHDSLVVADAAAGEWRVVVDKPAKMAIWLTGCPNIFAAQTDSLWTPHVDTGTAEIAVSSNICGVTPRLASLLPERDLPAFAYDSLRAVGIESANYYLQQNRHGDSLVNRFTRWDKAYRKNLGIGVSHGILQTFPPLLAKVDTSAAPMVRALSRLDGNDTFFVAIADEPNFTMPSPATFVPALSAAVAAAGSRPIMAIPESAGFLNGPMATDAAQRRGRDWAATLLTKYGISCGALTWHEWNIRDLAATEFYHRSIDSAGALSKRYPGGASRRLMITQTNIACGADFSPAQQEGFYAALWYASVIAQCAATGKLAFLGWFPAVDDDHHRKGLMSWDGIHLRIRPVGRAAAIAAHALLPIALNCTSQAFEVDGAASRSSGGDSLAILLVNKGPRIHKTSVTIDLSAPLSKKALQVEMIRLEESGLSKPTYPPLARAAVQKLTFNLPPGSITAIVLSAGK